VDDWVETLQQLHNLLSSLHAFVNAVRTTRRLNINPSQEFPYAPSGDADAAGIIQKHDDSALLSVPRAAIDMHALADNKATSM